jgi:bifunctional DNA-binding transcriptional regulator/antitoxin component of YhaV-PrlF toxin-antitoxin module
MTPEAWKEVSKLQKKDRSLFIRRRRQVRKMIELLTEELERLLTSVKEMRRTVEQEATEIENNLKE